MILFSSNHSLPSPDQTSIDIMDGTTKIATQGYAGKNVLETIAYSTEGVDPKDKQYFSYYLTSDKKYFQLMAFLEEEGSLQNKAGATDYTSRYATVFGDKLGILTDKANNPLQETGTSSIDISNLGATEYVSHFQDGDSIVGSGATLSILTNVAKVGGQFCGGSNLSCTNPNEVSDWRAIDPNCDIPDIVVGNQTWAGCNSTIGNGVILNETETNDCRDYNNTNTNSTGCSGYDKKESDYDSTHGVNNIWGKLYLLSEAQSSNACGNGYHIPSLSDYNTDISNYTDAAGFVNGLKIPIAGHGTVYPSSGNGFYARGKDTYLLTTDIDISKKVTYNGTISYGSDFTNSSSYYFSIRCIKD